MSGRIVTAVALSVLLAGCAAVSSGNSASVKSGSGNDNPPAVDTGPPVADPHVRFTNSCDYLLGDFSGGSSGYRFVARATLHNTGNVGTSVLVKASWVQVGNADVRRAKTVNVGWHGTKVVNFSVPVTQGQIDQIQSGQDAGSICHVSARMTGTFGSAH